MFQLNKNKIVVFNLFLIPILVGFWIVALIDSDIFGSSLKYCAILPLVFVLGIVFVYFCKKNNLSDIHLIIILMFFVKLYILPILVILNGGFNIQKYNHSISAYFFDAVIIQIIEWTVVVFCLCFMRINKIQIDFFDRVEDRVANKRIWKIIFGCMLIILIAFVKYPSLLNKYRPIFFTSEAQEILWKQGSTIAMSSMPSLIYYPINWLVSITRLSFVYLMIVLIWRYRRNKSQTMSVALSIIIVVVGLVMIVPDDVAASIIAAISILVLITKLYPQKSRKIITFMFIAGGILFIYMFFGRALTSDVGIGESLTQLIERVNAYFSGFINTSAVFEMECDSKMAYFGGDFFRSFPIIKGFFVNMPTTTELFNRALGYDPIYNSQIIPLAGQAYFYLNVIGVIVVPIFIMRICFYFYNKMLDAKGTYDYFINCFYTLLFAFGIVMYDSFLIFYLCLSYLPLLIINSYTLKQRGEKENERINIS